MDFSLPACCLYISSIVQIAWDWQITLRLSAATAFEDERKSSAYLSGCPRKSGLASLGS